MIYLHVFTQPVLAGHASIYTYPVLAQVAGVSGVECQDNVPQRGQEMNTGNVRRYATCFCTF